MKYVYCIPRAGFNDTLCQLEMAWGYAIWHGRTFIADTRFSALDDALGRYFVSDSADAVLWPDDELLRRLNERSAYPPFLGGTLGTSVGAVPARLAAAHPFDFNAAYDEDVVVLYGWGGGLLGADCLRRMRMRPGVAADVLRGLSGLPDDYVAIHVRNTDYRTDYLAFFKSVFPGMAGKTVVICSDDVTCREAAKRFFVESTVLTVTNIPDTGGEPIHFLTDDVYGKNIAMLTDLFALAGAGELLVPSLVEGGVNGLSGFSALALQLHHDPDLRRALLGLAEIENRPT